MSTQISSLHIRRSILIMAGPALVWQEFMSFERFAAWFSRGHTLEIYEPRLGGSVELSVDIDGESWHFGGPILAFEDGRELTFEDHWKPPHTNPVSTFITFRLTALYGGTHVELLHHGWDRFGADAARNHAGVERSWDLKHLLALQTIVEA
jgi:uncharacterized protein YndB with AHSA1/START domain